MSVEGHIFAAHGRERKAIDILPIRVGLRNERVGAYLAYSKSRLLCNGNIVWSSSFGSENASTAVLSGTERIYEGVLSDLWTQFVVAEEIVKYFSRSCILKRSSR